MRVISRAVIAAALLAAMLGPGRAYALVISECGGTYTRTTTCMFFAVGPNLAVYGSTNANGLAVRISDPSGNVRLLSCDGQFSCNAAAGIDSTGTDSVGPPAGTGWLLCTVVTNGSGYYRCMSNV